MSVEIISRSISTKVWDRTGIELATPGSAVQGREFDPGQVEILWRLINVITQKLSKPGNTSSLLSIGNFCLLLIAFANSLDPDQALQNAGPDLVSNCLVL